MDHSQTPTQTSKKQFFFKKPDIPLKQHHTCKHQTKTGNEKTENGLIRPRKSTQQTKSSDWQGKPNQARAKRKQLTMQDTKEKNK